MIQNAVKRFLTVFLRKNIKIYIFGDNKNKK